MMLDQGVCNELPECVSAGASILKLLKDYLKDEQNLLFIVTGIRKGKLCVKINVDRNPGGKIDPVKLNRQTAHGGMRLV